MKSIATWSVARISVSKRRLQVGVISAWFAVSRSADTRCIIFYVMVPTVDLALTRIRGRVAGGGHDIPESTVRRRFGRSMHNFFAYYRQLGDSWIIFDNSGGTPAVIAFGKEGKSRIMKPEVYQTLIDRYGRS